MFTRRTSLSVTICSLHQQYTPSGAAAATFNQRIFNYLEASAEGFLFVFIVRIEDFTLTKVEVFPALVGFKMLQDAVGESHDLLICHVRRDLDAHHLNGRQSAALCIRNLSLRGDPVPRLREAKVGRVTIDSPTNLAPFVRHSGQDASEVLGAFVPAFAFLNERRFIEPVWAYAPESLVQTAKVGEGQVLIDHAFEYNSFFGVHNGR